VRLKERTGERLLAEEAVTSQVTSRVTRRSNSLARCASTRDARRRMNPTSSAIENPSAKAQTMKRRVIVRVATTTKKESQEDMGRGDVQEASTQDGLIRRTVMKSLAGGAILIAIMTTESEAVAIKANQTVMISSISSTTTEATTVDTVVPKKSAGTIKKSQTPFTATKSQRSSVSGSPEEARADIRGREDHAEGQTSTPDTADVRDHPESPTSQTDTADTELLFK